MHHRPEACDAWKRSTRAASVALGSGACDAGVESRRTVRGAGPRSHQAGAGKRQSQTRSGRAACAGDRLVAWRSARSDRRRSARRTVGGGDSGAGGAGGSRRTGGVPRIGAKAASLGRASRCGRCDAARCRRSRSPRARRPCHRERLGGHGLLRLLARRGATGPRRGRPSLRHADAAGPRRGGGAATALWNLVESHAIATDLLLDLERRSGEDRLWRIAVASARSIRGQARRRLAGDDRERGDVPRGSGVRGSRGGGTRLPLASRGLRGSGRSCPRPRLPWRLARVPRPARRLDAAQCSRRSSTVSTRSSISIG